jgi:signal transduction histidine kinase
MRLPLRERLYLSGVVVVLVAVLVGLALLQYHWSAEVSRATTARLQGDLQTSMLAWREDLYRELGNIFLTMQDDPAKPLREKSADYARQYQTWARGSQHAGLVSGVYLFEAGSRQPQLLQLDRSTSQFEPVAWPDELDPLRQHLLAVSTEMSSGGPHHPPHNEFRHHPGPPDGAGNRRTFMFDMMPSMIDLNNMVMLRPQVERNAQPAHGKAGGESRPRAVDWLLVTLDRKVFQEHLLPELADRHFSGPQGLDFQVAIASGASGKRGTVYSTDAGFGGQDFASADGVIPVFGPAFGPPRRGMPPFMGQAVHRALAPSAMHERPDMAVPGPLRVDAIAYGGQQADWQLVVRHRKGSLEAVVTGMRRRNLAISFGVLLVLAGGIGMIVVTSQRARMLARLQMDFVAAVSHELRTPLAVIASAADNITHGVVEGKQQMTQYGGVIKSQARQLTNLVEQILLFASTRDSRHHYSLHPLHIDELVEVSLNNTAGLIHAAGFTVEKDVRPNLPPVMGDLSALSHCLQNLITNAVKYGGDARWMRISAAAAGNEIQITVEDRGLGIEGPELRHIFEPFYRSPAVASAQIHGTGLGLPLAKSIAQAMGGNFTVVSEPGKGSAFTLHLPCADPLELESGMKAGALPNPKFS